jgi:hypothetical protein
MNNPSVNWKSIITAFAKQFLSCVSEKGEPDTKAIKCLSQTIRIQRRKERHSRVSARYSVM